MTTDAAGAVAAFDVDGTLTVRDCVKPFLLHGVVDGKPVEISQPCR